MATQAKALLLAQFHFRRGNEVACTFRPSSTDGKDGSRTNDQPLNTEGIEFKALPSGGHLCTKDVIVYEVDSSTLGIAVFRNVKLPVREGAPSAGPAQQQQRGARMFSVSALLDVQTSPESPSSSSFRLEKDRQALLAAASQPLEELAEEISTVLVEHQDLDLAELQILLDTRRLEGKVGNGAKAKAKGKSLVDLLRGNDKAAEKKGVQADTGADLSLAEVQAHLVDNIVSTFEQVQTNLTTPASSALGSTNGTISRRYSIADGSPSTASLSDPLLFLPSQHHTLGPLLTKLLKLILPLYLRPSHDSSLRAQRSGAGRRNKKRLSRFLIYAPAGGGASVHAACMLASNSIRLAEGIMEDVQQEEEEEEENQREEDGQQQTTSSRMNWSAWKKPALFSTSKGKQQQHADSLQQPLRNRGFISVHDLPSLLDTSAAPTSSTPSLDQPTGWIAVTSDRILIDKVSVFDVLLDLSNCQPTSFLHAASPASGSTSIPAATGTGAQQYMPTISLVVQGDGRGNSAKLVKETWRTREFTVWNQVDEAAEEMVDTWRSARRAAARRRKSSKSFAGPKGSNVVSGEDAPGSPEARRMPGAYSRYLVTKSGGASGNADTTTFPQQRHGLVATFLAFLRFCLGTWTWLPSFFSLALSSRLSIIPLGIRGDGAARGSLLLLDDDDEAEDEGDFDEEEDESIDGDAAANGALAQPKAIPSSSSQDDPLLAAAGATSFSRSPLTLSSRRPTNPFASAEVDPTSGSSAAAFEEGSHVSGLQSSGSGFGATSSNISIQRARQYQQSEAFATADALLQAWIDWGSDLLLATAQAINEAASLKLEDNDIEGDDDAGEASSGELLIKAKHLRTLQLTPRLESDLDLVRSVAALNAVTARKQLHFQTGWRRFLHW